MPHGPIPDKPEVKQLVDAALKLADIHDETVDGEWGSGEGDTRTAESEAVRAAAADLQEAVPGHGGSGELADLIRNAAPECTCAEDQQGGDLGDHSHTCAWGSFMRAAGVEE